MKIDSALVEKRLAEGWHWYKIDATWYLCNGEWAGQQSLSWIKFSEDHYVPSWLTDENRLSFEIVIPTFKKVKIPRKLLRKAGIGYGAKVKITVERIS